MGIWSTEDIALSERQMVSTRQYVQAEWTYRRIDGAGHWLQLDAPEKLNPMLLEFLR